MVKESAHKSAPSPQQPLRAPITCTVVPASTCFVSGFCSQRDPRKRAGEPDGWGRSVATSPPLEAALQTTAQAPHANGLRVQMKLCLETAGSSLETVLKCSVAGLGIERWKPRDVDRVAMTRHR